MADWYYTTHGERQGPVPLEDLRRAAADGRLRETDKAWTEGWTAWRAAGDVPGLRFGDDGAGPAAEAATNAVGYFAPAGLPQRAARALAGYAPPTGDWPLDDAHLSRLAEAGLARRRVRRAYGLYRSLCVLTALAAVVAAIGVAAAGGFRSVSSSPAAVPIAFGVMILFAVLYGLAARATRRNFGWGCWAVGVALVLSSLVSLYGIAAAVSVNNADAAVIAIANAISLLFNAFFFGTTVLGLGGIKAFRASPAWCQEALVRGEATKRQRDPA